MDTSKTVAYLSWNGKKEIIPLFLKWVIIQKCEKILVEDMRMVNWPYDYDKEQVNQ